MASTVSWLSFDAEQQRRTQLMLAALSGQGTVDELGLGIIRDLIARALHPGLSVLHQRAKYLLFIPRDYQGLPTSSVEKMLAAGRRAEASTASRLVAYYRDRPETRDDVGIIGRRQGELTQQLPSGMYWGLLRQLGILREPGSLYDYCRRRVDEANQRAARTAFHEEGEVVEKDFGAWAELPEGEFTGFSLSNEESEWLRQRFLLTEQRPEAERSLVSWLLDPARTTWWEGARYAWEHPERDRFPAATAEAMRLGRDLDAFIHSARIAYNYFCAEGRPDQSDARDELMAKYETAMKGWQDDIVDNMLALERLDELNAWAMKSMTEARATHAARLRWRLTDGFLRDWLQVMSQTDDPLLSAQAAEVLRRRESTLKQGRARLGNSELLRGWAGDSGYFHLDYNWSVAMRLCGDIHGVGENDGLGTPRRHVSEVAA